MVNFSFRSNSKNGIVGIICGIAVFCLFLFIEMNNNRYIGIIAGVIICIFGLNTFLFNRNAYIQIENNLLTGKYHFFGKINCNLSDVQFVFPQINTISILLRNGKRYVIMGIENPRKLCYEISKNMSFDSSEHPEAIIEKLNSLKQKKKKYLIICCIFTAMMFINLFLTYFLTDEKDINEFNNGDWIIFIVMSVIEITIIILSFYFAQKAGILNLPIEYQQYSLRRTILETKPLPLGYVLRVYIDIDCLMRVTFFGYPHKDDTYYYIQEIAPDFTLIRTYESEVSDEPEQLQIDSEGFIDITEKLICNH